LYFGTGILHMPTPLVDVPFDKRSNRSVMGYWHSLYRIIVKRHFGD